MKNSRYTLIELIVTVAIIGILVTLFFAAMEKGFEVVKEKQCVSNLRSQGTLFGAHTGDNRNFLPSSTAFSGSLKMIIWDEKAMQYVDTSVTTEVAESRNASGYQTHLPQIQGSVAEVFQCPNDPHIETNKWAQSYSQNEGDWKGTGHKPGIAPNCTFFGSKKKLGKPMWSYNTAWLIDPSNNIIHTERFAESGKEKSFGSTSATVTSAKKVREEMEEGTIARYHADLKQNYLMGDMHVETMAFEETYAGTDSDLMTGAYKEIYGTKWDCGLRSKGEGRFDFSGKYAKWQLDQAP